MHAVHAFKNGRLIFIHHQCWKVLSFCRFQRQRCIKILCPKDPDFYTPLALKTAKGQHLPALVVYKYQSPKKWSADAFENSPLMLPNKCGLFSMHEQRASKKLLSVPFFILERHQTKGGNGTFKDFPQKCFIREGPFLNPSTLTTGPMLNPTANKHTHVYIYIYICCKVSNWATFWHFQS